MSNNSATPGGDRDSAMENRQKKKRTVFYVQPLIARYRIEVVQALAMKFSVNVFADLRGLEARGFTQEIPNCELFVETDIKHVLSNRVKIQRKILRHLFRRRPSVVFIFADVTYISLWLVLLAGQLLRIPIVVHGQGLYRYPAPGFTRILCYRAIVRLSTRYICYSQISQKSLKKIGCSADKLIVASNSLSITHVVHPHEKTGDEIGVLFLGRLRDRANVELLILAVDMMRQKGYRLLLHLVGDGEYGERLKNQYGDRDYIHWYGAIFDEIMIANISRQCRIGCYPGAAGLSVVHMFALSLPVLVHDQLSLHMGPEPEYVEDGKTGYLYSHNGGIDSLVECLEKIWNLPVEKMRENGGLAFYKYQELNAPTLGEKLTQIIDTVAKS